MAGPGAITLERQGPVGIVSLNRPQKLNAIDRSVLEGLRWACDEVERDVSIRALVLRGEGRCFSAGADLAMVEGLVGNDTGFAQFMDEWHDTFSRVDTLPVPTIAAVHGVALAGGFELMQVCDLAVVAHDARVGDQHATFGLFPGGGSTQRLPRITSPRRAMWLLLSGEWIDGSTAVEWGLANRSTAEDEVLVESIRMASSLAERSPAASAAIKAAVRAGEGLPLGQALAIDRTYALSHMRSDDAIAGLEAFRQRTTPIFTRQI